MQDRSKEQGVRSKDKGAPPTTLHYPLFTFLTALTVYLLTMPPGLTFAHHGADGGELIAAAVTLGIPHPPGYPTYTLIGKLMSYLPIGSIAYRFNLLSALSMAGAATTATIVAMRSARPIAAVAAGLLFAFAPLAWSQAIITEVYALNALLLSLALWQMTRHKPHPIKTGFFLGLSMTTHLTSAMMFPLALLAFRPIQLPKLIIGVLYGLTPFLLLPQLALGDSPIVWGNPTNFDGWWWIVSGEVYRSAVLARPALPQFASVVIPTLQQFSFVGWLLLPASIIAYRQHQLTSRATPLHPLALTATALLYAIYAIKYDAVDSVVNAVPALLLCAVALAPGLQRLGVVALLLPLLSVALNYQAINLHNDTVVNEFTIKSLQSLPENAIALTDGDDRTVFSLWYAHHVEQIRDDVVLVDDSLFAFDWYRKRLARLNPELSALSIDDVDRFVRTNSIFRPICNVSYQERESIYCTAFDR